MAEMNRRTLLGSGAGIVGVTALGACAPADATVAAVASQGSDTRSGGADLNKTQPHLFHLTFADAATYRGGTIQQANEDTFPILSGQDASISFTRLQPGGVREPHWHPSAWEVNYVISGIALWTVLEPGGYRERFEAKVGDVAFLPRGSFHYFENAHVSDDLTVLSVFNSSATEPKDDIGIVASLNSMPSDVLAAVFGMPVDAFNAMPRTGRPVTITSKKP
jgi:oxalate decarboxylase